eukprot:CAMPEP_0185535546 /NCGR_PEP_ID=MMETSP1366-20130426/109499_1 /TAXON_ID=38817 /ORGANISM="Gephyrocapsa oceanica, Strain RCC1303" /LENGTH=180 /DNA_ID=CAMNT_0028147267 /DNA_START=256 /DNA_END=797 /DNA_ORIENTATION=+
MAAASSSYCFSGCLFNQNGDDDDDMFECSECAAWCHVECLKHFTGKRQRPPGLLPGGDAIPVVGALLPVEAGFGAAATASASATARRRTIGAAKSAGRGAHSRRPTSLQLGERIREVCRERCDVVDVPALEDCQDAGHVALGDEPLAPAQQRGLDGREQSHSEGSIDVIKARSSRLSTCA